MRGMTVIRRNRTDSEDFVLAWWLLGALAAAVLMLTACSGGANDREGTARRSPSPSASATPTTASTPTTTSALSRCDTAPTIPAGPAGQSAFVSGADAATALAFAPDGRLFFAERGGAIKIASGGQV